MPPIAALTSPQYGTIIAHISYQRNQPQTSEIQKKEKNYIELWFLLFSSSLVQMMKDLKWKQLFYTHSLKGTEPFYAPPT